MRLAVSLPSLRHLVHRSWPVLQQQHLFTVYVHARPTLKDYDEESVFGGRLIPDRIVSSFLTGWPAGWLAGIGRSG